MQRPTIHFYIPEGLILLSHNYLFALRICNVNVNLILLYNTATNNNYIQKYLIKCYV